jgi:hypothetical protein
MSTNIFMNDSEIEPNPEDFPGVESGKERPILDHILGGLTLAGIMALTTAGGAVACSIWAANEAYQQGRRVYYLARGIEVTREKPEDSLLARYEHLKKIQCS